MHRGLHAVQNPFGQVPCGLEVLVGRWIAGVLDVLQEVPGLLDPHPDGILVDVSAGDVVDDGLGLPEPAVRSSLDGALARRPETGLEIGEEVVRVGHGIVCGQEPFNGPVDKPGR